MNEFEEINIPEFLKNGKKTIISVVVILIIIISILRFFGGEIANLIKTASK